MAGWKVDKRLGGKYRDKDSWWVIPPWTYIEVTNNWNNVNGWTNPNDVVIVQQLADGLNNLPTVVRPRGTFEVILWATAEYPKAIATNAVNALQIGNWSWTWPNIRAWDAWRVLDTWLVGSWIEVDLWDFIIANVDNAGNNDADWYIQEWNSPIINITRANLLALISASRVVSSQNYRITDRRNAIVMWIATNAVSEYTQMLILNSEGLYNSQDEYIQCWYNVVSDEVYDIKDIRGNRIFLRISFANLYNYLLSISFWSINSLENDYYTTNIITTPTAIITWMKFLKTSTVTIFNDIAVSVEDSNIGWLLSIQENSSINNVTTGVWSNLDLSGGSSAITVNMLPWSSASLTDWQIINIPELTWAVTCLNGGLLGYGRYDWIHNIDWGSFIAWNFLWVLTVNIATNTCFYAWVYGVDANFNNDFTNITGWTYKAFMTCTNCTLSWRDVNFPYNMTFNWVWETDIRINIGYSNLTTLVDITWLTLLDLSTYIGYGRFRLSSLNATETINTIFFSNTSLDFDLLPESWLTTLNIVSWLGFANPRNEWAMTRVLNWNNWDTATYRYIPHRGAWYEIYSSTY